MIFFKKKKENSNLNSIDINHIGFIMDGNRRYSKKIRKTKKEGYSNGMNQFLNIIKYQIEFKIKETSFYALSRDNYKKRASEELEILRDLIKKFYNSKSKKIENFFKDNKIKLEIKGNLKEIKKDLKNKDNNITKRKFIDEILNFEKEIGKWNSEIKKPEFKVNICLNYDGQEEILHSFKEIFKKIKQGKIKEKEVDIDTIKENIYFSNSAPPEIIVRTGNAPRLSGFMLWDSKYSEIYLTKKLWPELTKEDFKEILIWYSKINRNFGK